MRSPKQVELRAKARGLKVPSEFIVSHALRHLAGARRKRTRPGARTGRARAVILRGTRSLPRREAIMNKQYDDHDHDHDHDPDPDNDNDGAVAPAPTGSALASAALTALAATFNDVDTAAIGGRPALPMLQFKSRRATAPGCSGRSDHPRSRQPLGRQPADVPVGLRLLGRRQQDTRRASWCRSASRCPTSRSCPTRASRGRRRWRST